MRLAFLRKDCPANHNSRPIRARHGSDAERELTRTLRSGWYTAETGAKASVMLKPSDLEAFATEAERELACSMQQYLVDVMGFYEQNVTLQMVRDAMTPLLHKEEGHAETG